MNQWLAIGVSTSLGQGSFLFKELNKIYQNLMLARSSLEVNIFAFKKKVVPPLPSGNCSYGTGGTNR